MPHLLRVTQRMARRMQLGLDDLLIGLYDGRQPRLARKFASLALQKLRSALIWYADGRAGHAVLWEGREIDTGQPMRVAYLADDRARHVLSPEYLCHILFEADTVQETDLGPFSMLHSRQKAQALVGQVDLVIVEQNQLLHWQPQAGLYGFSPPWVRTVFLLTPGEPWEAVEQRMRGQRNNIKLVRRKGFTLRVSQDPADFDLFYDRMHVPMVRERHTTYGWIEHKENMRAMFERGVLMLVDGPDGQPVCGELALAHGKVLFSVVNGTLDGDKRWHDEGGLSALYYLGIRWCYDQGMDCCDFGECRPFETDGLYRYKIRWGTSAVPNPWSPREWLFWAPAEGSVAAGWLKRHPFVSESSTAAVLGKRGQVGLVPVTGSGRPDEKDLAKMD